MFVLPVRVLGLFIDDLGISD